MKIAVVVKLARVILLAAVVPALALCVRRMALQPEDGEERTRPAAPVPGFVWGFLALVGVASLNFSYGFIPAEVLGVLKVAQTWLLGIAMFALGCGISVKGLRQIGVRPVALAAAATVVVAAVGLAGVALFL